MFKKLSAPVYVQWEVTPECNFNCVHCYNHWRQGKRNGRLVTEKTKAYYLASVTEIISNDVFAVTVTGGEPLLVFEEVLPYIKMLREAGVEVYFNSNLSLLTDETAAILKRIGIKSILTSLPSGVSATNDQITQRRNSRDRTVRGIKRALNAGLRVATNMVVTKLNLSEVYETACFVKEIGVTSFSATKAAVPGNCQDFSPYRLTLAEFRIMLSELARIKSELNLQIDSLEFYPGCSFGDDTTRMLFGSSRSCTAAKTSCTIGFDGQIRPCSHAPQTYGSVFDGLLQAWDNMEEWRQDNWIPDECQPCNLKRRCGGGCKIEALLVNGAINKPDPYCDYGTIPLKPFPKLKSASLDPQRPVRFNPGIKFRGESFGGLLCVGARNWVPVAPEMYEFVRNWKGGEVLLEDFSSGLGLSAVEATQVVNHLLNKRIVLQGE
jgi:radical SAM protein with 4Fe4S-binding SPASM domain